MSQLLILGNTNKYTFCNAIVAAQKKSKTLENENLTEIYVIHSNESFQKLFCEELDWLEFLKKYGITENNFINRIIDLESDTSTIFFDHIKNIIKNCQIDSLIIDISNGTSKMKTLLSILAYILDISNIYFIDSINLFKDNCEKNNSTIFFNEETIEKYYKKFEQSKEIDNLAYLNLTEIIRYKEKVDNLSKIFKQMNKNLQDNYFFINNLLNSIQLKLQNDNSKENSFDNTLYRISSTAFSSSIENLIDRISVECNIDKINNKNKPFEEATLGEKIDAIKNKLLDNVSENFDFMFLEKFNKFMLYLRNSTVHRALNTSESEKFKASLSLQMSLVFLEYYSTVVYNELKKIEKKSEIKKATILPLNNNSEKYYYGLDGDNTGKSLETLLLNNPSEKEIKKFSKNIKTAKDQIVKYINNSGKGHIIFAEGDDILFYGNFSMDELTNMKNIYYHHSGNMTCSIAYGKKFNEVLYSMKIAKIERNSIKGITFI